MIEEIELVVEKTGEEKKEYVLACIQKDYGNEIYERYEPLINLIIDFIIDVSKGKINLKKKFMNITKCCFSHVKKV